MLSTVGEMLERAGIGADGVVLAELPHNKWLSPGCGGSAPAPGSWEC